MHDPMTVAFEVKYPWRDKSSGTTKLFPKGYRRTFITVWHVDPETDGSDDSCGYSRPRLTKEQLDSMKSLAGDEAREPWFQQYFGKRIDSPTEGEVLIRQAFFLVGMVLNRRFGVKRVSFAEASEWACETMCNGIDNFRSSLCFIAGYHSNNPEDRESDREYVAHRFFCCLAGYILRERRHWWQHPRWHFWHWHLQIHPLQNFKRWAFTRCADCGKGFKWGQSGWTNQWNSDGPRWFRGEKDLHHDNCGGHGVASANKVMGVQP